ncbi:zinc finger BED domain-containing protein RICESLEEPER 1-like [Pistacia vera]|uniref:zinc finger BED domain-containing protein RICESLEEPER 1-like n=1 Tax=Pistacia vera TaxID=55513 RepID=UPI00126398BD|nr:zinc finger BED domain-containing protein RICESLEEPER 1-like [Pistacia vera]
MDDSIFRTRVAVRYVRSSPTRLMRFKECMEKEKIESKNHLVLDIETRWNPTYLMLDAAIKFQKAFDLLEIDYSKYKDELSSGHKSRGLPTYSDWEYARYLLPFLKIFYDATVCVFDSFYVTGNEYMREIYDIGMKISEWSHSHDLNLSSTAVRMKGKFDKYWSNVDNINIMLFIAVVLDPRDKLEYVDWVIGESYDAFATDKLKKKVMETLLSLFNHYDLCKVARGLTTQSSQQSPSASALDDCDVDIDPQEYMRVKFKKRKARNQANQPKSKLDEYLVDDLEDDNDKTFDLLKWWKMNSTKYQVLSLMARDVLTMHNSIVASELAFSTGGHVLDPFRSSLTTKMVEALICTQDWIQTTCAPLAIEETLDELTKIKSEFPSLRIESTHPQLND